jgi:acyl-CoA thioesterase-1
MRLAVSVILVGTLGCGAADSGKDTSGDTAGAVAIVDSTVSVASGSDTITRAAGRARVLIVGTSLTAGLGLDPEDAYPSHLQRKADSAGYNVEIVNAGLSGETSAGARRRIEWLLREPAAAVVIETGANDGLRGLDIDSTRANLTAILRYTKRTLPDARLLLIQMEAPPNLGESYTRRFRESFADVARAEGATLVPFLLENVAGDRRLNQNDGIHPNEEGARIVAANVWRGLGPVLQQIGRRD